MLNESIIFGWLPTAAPSHSLGKGKCKLRDMGRAKWHSAAIDGLRWLVFVRMELASFDVVGVLLNVGVPLLGKIIQREDRRNRADWYAGAAVDAQGQ